MSKKEHELNLLRTISVDVCFLMSSNFVALVCSFLKEVAKSKRRRNRKITYKNSYIFLISDGTLYVFETAKPVSITALFKIGNQESASETFYIDISLFKT